MSLPSTEPAAFTFHLEEATGLLRAYWPGPVADATLRGQYTQLLAAAKAHGNCRFWLLDLRDRNWPALPFDRWFGEGFASTAHAVLSQPVFIAYIVSPGHYAATDTPSVHTAQRHCATYDVYPFFFDSEPTALAWLAHQQMPGQ